MQITVGRTIAGTPQLTVTGEVDTATTEELLAAGTAVVSADGCIGLAVDLSGVTFIDSSGLAALIGIRNAAIAAENSLILVAPSRQVRRVLQITGLDQAFTLADGA